MTVTPVDPRLFTVLDEILTLDDDHLAQYLATLTHPERVALDQAFEQRWRRDPATFAAHLTAPLSERSQLRRWAYTRLLADKYRQAIEGESTRQIWMLPPRYGKTLLGSVWGTAWALDRYPWLNIILTSYGHKLAVKNSVQVKDIATEHANHLAFQPRHGRESMDRWETTEGGQVMAAGVGGAMTGFAGDLIVIDDPFRNWQDAASQLQRDKVWDWYQSVVYTRLQTPTSAIIIVGTRWHEDDLVGRCLAPPEGEPDDWDVVRLPEIAEDPDTGNKPWERIPDPLGRKPGDVLEPARFDADTVAKKHTAISSHLRAALLQQRPSNAEGELIKRAWWQYYTGRPPQPDEWLITWDSAFKGADSSDWCVGAVWCRQGANVYLIDLVRGRMDYPTFKQSVVSLARKWPEARTILIEDTANGPAVMAELRRSIMGIVPFSPQGSKESRVHAVSGVIEAGNVWLPDPGVQEHPEHGGRMVDRSFVHDFVNELSAFPTGAHDDQVDVTTMALLRWSNAGNPVVVSRYRNRAGRR